MTEKTIAKAKKCSVKSVTGGFEVTSPSGSTYFVKAKTTVNRYDGSATARLYCNCPARGECCHKLAVELFVGYNDGDSVEEIMLGM